RAKDIMARGELVPDSVVTQIVSERIDMLDAANGFILDGFPRTAAQAEALDWMLQEKGMRLDAVIELAVDESILMSRVEKRARETLAAGGTVREDDRPDVLNKRIQAYVTQTAPLVGYYEERGLIRRVDGMAPVDDVTAAIERELAGSAVAAR